MATAEELKEPTFGPLVIDPQPGATEAKSGWKGGEASGYADSDEDVSAPEEANESRLPDDPRAINEQQPPTNTEF